MATIWTMGIIGIFFQVVLLILIVAILSDFIWFRYEREVYKIDWEYTDYLQEEKYFRFFTWKSPLLDTYVVYKGRGAYLGASAWSGDSDDDYAVVYKKLVDCDVQNFRVLRHITDKKSFYGVSGTNIYSCEKRLSPDEALEKQKELRWT